MRKYHPFIPAFTSKVIVASHKAFPAWSARTAKDRAVALRKWAALLHEHTDYLASLITAEGGKPLAESRGETAYGGTPALAAHTEGASFVSWFAEEGLRVYGETIPAASPNQRILVLRQPVGVVSIRAHKCCGVYFSHFSRNVLWGEY